MLLNPIKFVGVILISSLIAVTSSASSAGMFTKSKKSKRIYSDDPQKNVIPASSVKTYSETAPRFRKKELPPPMTTAPDLEEDRTPANTVDIPKSSTPPPPAVQAPVQSVCVAGSITKSGCPVFSGGESSRQCNSTGTGYSQCVASCFGDHIVSGSTSDSPTCVARPQCPVGKTQCSAAGFNLAQDEYSIDCGEDGWDANRDMANWYYLGYGIIQNIKDPLVTGTVCCMKKDGSGLGCETVKVSIVPGQVNP